MCSEKFPGGRRNKNCHKHLDTLKKGRGWALSAQHAPLGEKNIFCIFFVTTHFYTPTLPIYPSGEAQNIPFFSLE